MLTYLMISAACGSLAGVLTATLYRRYLRRRDASPDFGPGLRRLARSWHKAAGEYEREASALAEGDPVADLYGAYSLAFGSCAWQLEALVGRAEAGGVAAGPVGSERALAEPVRRAGGDTGRGEERLARRLDGHLCRPSGRGSFPEGKE